MATVYFVGNGSVSESFTPQPFEIVLMQFETKNILGVDTETNVTRTIYDRELRVLAISWLNDGDVDMAVIQFSSLTNGQINQLAKVLKTKLCIAHNMAFDYQILKKYGIQLNKTYCTMNAEKVLLCGYSSASMKYSLQSLYMRRFQIDLSKTEQLKFNEDTPLTDSKIRYAALDTYKLHAIREQQLDEARKVDLELNHRGNKGLVKTIWWENEYNKVIADREYYGYHINKKKWHDISHTLKPDFDKALKELNAFTISEHEEELYKLGFMSKEPYIKDLRRSKVLIEFLKLAYPGLEKTSALPLLDYLRTNDPEFPHDLIPTNSKARYLRTAYAVNYQSNFSLLKILIGGTTNAEESLKQFLISNFEEEMIKEGYYIPANTLNLNWGSPAQRKQIFKLYDPEIESTDKETVEKYSEKFEFFSMYKEYAYNYNLLKSFGTHFYDDYVDSDGRHRSSFNQVLSTGRVSSREPNCLNIPREARFRQCFVPQKPENRIIGADFDGQELVIMAILSNEPTWIEAIKQGWDIHSMNASLVYGAKWAFAAENDCEFEKSKKKCSCPEHQIMRTNCKTVTFSLSYGGTFIRIAALLKIPQDEAKELLKSFHANVPAIGQMMQRFGSYALNKGFITEPFFGRVRYFDKWKLNVPTEHGSISRQAYNMPIQSSGGAMLKVAEVLVRRWIYANNYQGRVIQSLAVHDKICRV